MMLTKTIRLAILLPALLVARPAAAQLSNSETKKLQIAQVQTLLDRSGFSPGEIDGVWGKNARTAMRAFQLVRGLTASGEFDGASIAELQRIAGREVLVPYVITPADADGPFVDRIPGDLVEQSGLPGLYYTSVLEALGEKFHADPDLLKLMNPAARFVAGEQIVVPDVFNEPQVPRPDRAADATITVSRSISALSMEDAEGRLLFFAPVTTGSDYDPLPLGVWKVQGVDRNPTFHYNPDLFWDADTSHTKAKIPAGPNNPVGLVWIDLSKEHYGLHGTPSPGTVGHTESHGCVRLTNWDALKLSALVRVGTPVVFTE